MEIHHQEELVPAFYIQSSRLQNISIYAISKA